MSEPADVAIVGCGPVGQLLAILLGQRGWRVRVLERWPEPYPLPRAVHFDHEIARLLQSAGVMEALAGRTEAASVYEWRNAAGEVLLRIGRDAERSLSGWPESLMFCQPELEAILDARVRSLPTVSVERGCEVIGARHLGSHVDRRGATASRPFRSGPATPSAATAPTAWCAARSAPAGATSASTSTGSSWTWCPASRGAGIR